MANDCILALDDLLSPLEQELETDNTNDCLINNKLQAAVAEQQPPPGFCLGDLDSEAYLAMPQKQISAKTPSLAVVFDALETAVQLSSEEESPERVGDVLRRLKQLFVELSSRILDISLNWERIASDGIPIYTEQKIMHLRLHLEYMMVFIAGQRLTKYFLANSDIWTLFRNANNSASSSAGNVAAGLFQSELPGKINIGFWEWHYMGLLEKFDAGIQFEFEAIKAAFHDETDSFIQLIGELDSTSRFIDEFMFVIASENERFNRFAQKHYFRAGVEPFTGSDLSEIFLHLNRLKPDASKPAFSFSPSTNIAENVEPKKETQQEAGTPQKTLKTYNRRQKLSDSPSSSADTVEKVEEVETPQKTFPSEAEKDKKVTGAGTQRPPSPFRWPSGMLRSIGNHLEELKLSPSPANDASEFNTAKDETMKTIAVGVYPFQWPPNSYKWHWKGPNKDAKPTLIVRMYNRAYNGAPEVDLQAKLVPLIAMPMDAYSTNLMVTHMQWLWRERGIFDVHVTHLYLSDVAQNSMRTLFVFMFGRTLAGQCAHLLMPSKANETEKDIAGVAKKGSKVDAKYGAEPFLPYLKLLSEYSAEMKALQREIERRLASVNVDPIEALKVLQNLFDERIKPWLIFKPDAEDGTEKVTKLTSRLSKEACEEALGAILGNKNGEADSVAV